MINTKCNSGAKINFKVRDITKISLLSAIAFLLMVFAEFPLPLFPSFLKLDLSDLPALVGGFAMGPVTGIIIEFIKNLLHFFFKSETGGVGNLANFIVGIGFVVPAAVVYSTNKTKKGAVIGMAVGTVTMTLLASLANYYVLIPLYAKVYSMDAILNMMSQANKAIVDLKTYIVYAVIPFNVLKAVVVSIITLFIYKKVSPILHR
ncbi:ECF transporter S component [Caldicoprobacter algeriensis]|uniref:ECF transporter S component n=1 Tax=Caldicoprobacter algeriensis TaxID=699281 RepID=UPI002079E27C|nr:ECF transporter S component [Caldicoprobacter algeriensis]MCM8900316.1 ECF transporter S component [Caldicoprobacter algeriensis]